MVVVVAAACGLWWPPVVEHGSGSDSSKLLYLDWVVHTDRATEAWGSLISFFF